MEIGCNMIIYELQPIYKVVGTYDKSDTIKNENDIHDYIHDAFDKYLDQEQIWIICLNGTNAPICRKMLSLGTTNNAPVYIKEIFKIAFLTGAVSFILCHNHPSGNLEASNEDINITKKVIDASKLVGVPLIDHVILSPDKRICSIRKGNSFLWS